MASTTQPTRTSRLPMTRQMIARRELAVLLLLLLSIVAIGVVSGAAKHQLAPPPTETIDDQYLPSASYEYYLQVVGLTARDGSAWSRDSSFELEATNVRQQLLIGSGPSQPTVLASPIDYQFDVFHNVGQQLLIGSGHGAPLMGGQSPSPGSGPTNWSLAATE